MKLELFQKTLPQFVESTNLWDRKNPKAIEMHKDVFEFLIESNHPWSMVEDRGFIR